MTDHVRRGWPWRRQVDEQKGGESSAAAETPSALPLPEAILDESALRTRYKITDTPTFMFISLFGMASEAITKRAELVDEELASKSLIPVYLVDEPNFLPFRAEQRLFEHLPSRWRAEQRCAGLDWPFYLRRRYLLLQAKWQPIGRIDFGEVPDWLPEDRQVIPDGDATTPRR